MEIACLGLLLALSADILKQITLSSLDHTFAFVTVASLIVTSDRNVLEHSLSDLCDWSCHSQYRVVNITKRGCESGYRSRGLRHGL